MSETEDGMAGVSDVANVVATSDTDAVRLAAGIAPTDLTEFVAMYGSGGGSPAAVEFADGGCYTVEKLLDIVSTA